MKGISLSFLYFFLHFYGLLQEIWGNCHTKCTCVSPLKTESYFQFLFFFLSCNVKWFTLTIFTRRWRGLVDIHDELHSIIITWLKLSKRKSQCCFNRSIPTFSLLKSEKNLLVHSKKYKEALDFFPSKHLQKTDTLCLFLAFFLTRKSQGIGDFLRSSNLDFYFFMSFTVIYFVRAQILPKTYVCVIFLILISLPNLLC